MKQEIIVRLHKSFEEAAHEKDGVEFWFARNLQDLLGYTQWRNFLQVIDKAKTACANAGQHADDHFVDVSKIVTVGSGTERPVEDRMLIRAVSKKWNTDDTDLTD